MSDGDPAAKAAAADDLTTAGAEQCVPRVLPLGLLGALGLWLAQPPVGWWPLAWAAPAAWLALAEQPARWRRRDYAKLWLAGVVYWLLAVHWVRLPHPLTPIGWVLLAMYLGCYPLTTVAAVRGLLRRAVAPLWLAGSVVWVAAEFVQARLFTGFLMGAVSHSQAGQPWVRGVAAYVGAYGVTFLVVAVAATLAWACRSRSPLPRRIAWVLAATFAAWLTGEAARRTMALDSAPRVAARLALVQADIRATWDPDPGRSQRIMDRHVELSAEAVNAARNAGEPIDVVVWPESMFRTPVYTFAGERDAPTDALDWERELVERRDAWFESLATWFDAVVIAGADRFDAPSRGRERASRGDHKLGFDGRSSKATRGDLPVTRVKGAPSPDDAVRDNTSVYNSVVLIDRGGRLAGWYDKTHLVPFGEYIPLAGGVPALYYLTPMSGGLGVGSGPVGLSVPLRGGGTLNVCPSVCYETVVPHLPRAHVAELIDRGQRPDLLVNVTNDAWFWGSSELDMHLACAVFRAIETGTPMAIAANGGLSALVDARGEVVAVSERQTEQTLVVTAPPRTVEPTPYTRYGDAFAQACCIATLAGLFVAWRRGRAEAGG